MLTGMRRTATIPIERMGKLTPRGAEPASSPSSWRKVQPTLGELFRGVSTDFSTLLRLEARLARVETREKLGRSLGSLGWITGGGSLFYIAILAWMISAATGYGLFLPFWLAVLLIALFTLVLGAMLIQVGRKRLKQRSLCPSSWRRHPTCRQHHSDRRGIGTGLTS